MVEFCIFRSLPKEQMGHSGVVDLAQLRIVQRMRLESPQLESVQSKMFDQAQSCTMLALPCDREADNFTLNH